MADLTVDEEMELVRQDQLLRRMVAKLTSLQLNKGFWHWRRFSAAIAAERTASYVYELLGENTDTVANRDGACVQRCMEWVTAEQLLPKNMSSLQVEFFSSHLHEIIHRKRGEKIFEDHDGSSFTQTSGDNDVVLWAVLRGKAQVKCRQKTLPRVQKSQYVVTQGLPDAFRLVDVHRGEWFTRSSAAALPHGTGPAVESTQIKCIPGVSACAQEDMDILAVSRKGFSGSFGVYFDTESIHHTAMRIIASMPEFKPSWDTDRIRPFLRRNVEMVTFIKETQVLTEPNTMSVLCSGECQVVCRVKDPATGRRVTKVVASIASPGSILGYSRAMKDTEEEQKKSAASAKTPTVGMIADTESKVVVCSTAEVLIIKLRAIDISTLNRVEQSLKRIEVGRSQRLSQILKTVAALEKESSLSASKRRRLNLLDTSSHKILDAKRDFKKYVDSMSSWKSEVDKNLKQTLDSISGRGSRRRRHSHA